MGKCLQLLNTYVPSITDVELDVDWLFQHFLLALKDSRPCSTSPFEINFHIAHALELQGKYRSAREKYEQLLQHDDLPSAVRANTHRQLGEH